MNQEEFFAALKELVMESIRIGGYEALDNHTFSADRERLFFAAAELSLQYGDLHDKVFQVRPT